MEKNNTCFFTGHRLIAEKVRPPLYADLLRYILQMHSEGIRYFISGGALGFDMLAAGAVLQSRQFREDIRLVLILPCRNQTEHWTKTKSPTTITNLRTYQHIKDEANAVQYVSDLYYDGCMRERNARMVELGSRCIAFWNGSAMSGTAQTVRMAQKANLPIVNLWRKADAVPNTPSAQ